MVWSHQAVIILPSVSFMAASSLFSKSLFQSHSFWHHQLFSRSHQAVLILSSETLSYQSFHIMIDHFVNVLLFTLLSVYFVSLSQDGFNFQEILTLENICVHKKEYVAFKSIIYFVTTLMMMITNCWLDS